MESEFCKRELNSLFYRSMLQFIHKLGYIQDQNLQDCTKSVEVIYMKDLNVWTFTAGLLVSSIVGIIAVVIFKDLTFSGLCIVSTAILFSHSLENTNHSEKQ